MKKISVIIPVYFNEGSLYKLFEELKNLELNLNNKNYLLELIFVDDGSGDQSINKLIEFKNKRNETKIIKLTRNFGANLASKEGLKYATGDCFTILAADLQDPPELILKMIEYWELGNKLVICVRKSREDPFFKKLTARIFYILIRKLVINNYPKHGFDMALFDSSILSYIINSSKSLYLSVYLYWLGYKPKVILYDRLKRSHGKSRWTIYKNINASLDMLLGFSPKFTQLISIFGLFISSLSFLYGIKLIFGALSGNVPVPGYASTVVLISFFSGLIILYLTIIQEYLTRIYGELNRKTDVVVEKVFE